MKKIRRLLKTENPVNLFFGIIEKLCSYRYLNVWKTIYINFRSLPPGQAIRFPIVVWGRIKIITLMGRIIINAPVRTGMIKLGVPDPREFTGYTPSVFSNLGTIVFNGNAMLNNGIKIRVHREARLEFGKEVAFNAEGTIYAVHDILIGDYSRFAFNALIMSSDLHFSINTDTRTVYPCNAPIIIGSHNWFGSHVKVMKGTITPDWAIVTANSFLNRDYVETCGENAIIGGCPARLIRKGRRRVFSLRNEAFLADYFRRTGNDSFLLDEHTSLDDFCKR